jgi:hypothetical protein
MKTPGYFIVAVMILVLFVSCSKGVNPLTPDSIVSEPPTVSETGTQFMDNPYRGVFGAWKVIIDPDTLTAEIEPARNAQAIGLIVDADLSQFLTISPCNNCLRITGVRYNHNQGLILEIGLRHPFLNGAARPDLHGFDVRLIFMIEEPWPQTWDKINMVHPGGVEEPVTMSWVVYNPDGFTSHWDELPADERYFQNGSDVSGNINPFIRYFEDYSTGAFDPHAPVGQNVMPSGSDWETQDVLISSQGMDMGLPLYLVADVAYGQSAVLANRQNPQYYLPAFHRTEPWRYEYWIENNFRDETDPTSTVDVVVQVFDWQQGATVDPSYPNPSNLAGIPESSNVLRVELSVPSIQDDPVIQTASEGGTGTPTDPLKYRLTLTNTNLNGYNAYGLLAIRDELYGHTGRLPVPESPSGFPLSTVDILDYSIYDIVEIPYDRGEQFEYGGEFNVYARDLYTDYDKITLDGSFFMDQAGMKFQYDWDYDYDGVTFNTDGAGMPSPEITLPYTGINDIGLRVQTNSVPPQEYTYTIPVFRKGVDGKATLDTGAGTQKDAVGYNLSSAVGASENNYYIAFTSEAGGKRDIWLGIIDQDGNCTTQNLTSSLSQHCFHPAIAVVDDGLHDGVYVVFNLYDATDWDLYSTYGNLDGTGFDASHINFVSNAYKYNAFADLEYAFGRLLVYYWGTNTSMPEDVAIAYSDDMALSWTMHPTPIDNGTSQKTFPSATLCISMPRMWVVWEDYRDSSTTGGDLYMAQSYLGLNFDPAMNISSLGGYSHENVPDAVSDYAQMAVVYMGQAEYETDSCPRLKIVDLYSYATIDFKVGYQIYNKSVSRPTVSFPYETQIAVAYGTQDLTTSEMHAVSTLIHLERGYTDYRQDELFRTPIGTEPSLTTIMSYYGVAMFSRPLCDNYATENVFFYTDFANGAKATMSPFEYTLGEISVAKVIGPGRDKY